MTLSEALEKISKALGVLAYQTHTENLAGMFSKNKLTEDLLLPVLRVVLGAPQLRNVNREVQNFPYIDLADDRARIAVQVTTERTAAKTGKTLTGFIAQGYHKSYDRLIIFIFTPNAPRYGQRTKQRWNQLCRRKLRFDPRKDIITTLSLFRLIEGLAQDDVYAVHDIISSSVIGERFVNVNRHLSRLSIRQLENEKKSGKYIPDIFVETRETKNLARSFCHPALFFHRTLDSLSRLDISGWNKRLAKTGLPALPFPDLARHRSAQKLADVGTAAAQLSERLAELTEVLDKYKEGARKDTPPFPVRPDRRYIYDQYLYTLEGSLGISFNYRVQDLVNEVKAASAPVLLLTGRAGQGKTNLVCDLVETFILKHKIPCAYLTGRVLRSLGGQDLGDGIQRFLFEGETTSFAEAARLLSDHASRLNKPFVLIVDGINEHHRISEFSEQLEQFIQVAIEYPNLKLLLTCRSEFFQQRFGNLVAGGLKPSIFLWEANERHLSDERYTELLAGYFTFFQVRGDRVCKRVVQSLRQDLLLLRFFCEAYGARGKPEGYQQPLIANIYREEIFSIYLKRKLGMAEGFFHLMTGRVRPTGHRADLVRVLEQCLEYMLKQWQFSLVPVSAIGGELSEALYALLDEELILRRDLPEGISVFAPSEEAINFTFDDFRDFLLAQYLLDRVYLADRNRFEQCIARNDPKDTQITEGLKKFLFYASRHKRNEEFWEFYKDRTWYTDVYDEEIFNIDTKLLRPADRDKIAEALIAGGDRARMIAQHLVYCWNPKEHLILNLNLLLSVVMKGGDERFDDLIAAPFKTLTYRIYGTSAAAISMDIVKYVLPRLRPRPDAPEHDLFRFLVLLLPVDSGPDLNSESFAAFRRLLELHPAYGIDLLRETLGHSVTRHRAHVWRLLTLVRTSLSPRDSLFKKARLEQARSAKNDPVVHREVSRFLDGNKAGVAGKTS